MDSKHKDIVDNNIKEKINIDQSLKIIAKSSIIILCGIFISKLLTYIYRIIIARTFGPEIYGVFSLILMIVGILTPIINLGLNEGLLRFIPQWRGKNEIAKICYAKNLSIKIIFVNSVIISSILFIFADYISMNLFHEPQLISFLKIISICLIAIVYARFFLVILRSYELVISHTLIEKVLTTFIHVGSLCLLIYIGFKEQSIIYSYVIGFIITLIISYFIVLHKLHLISSDQPSSLEKRSIRNEIILYSIPIMFSGIITVLFTWVDTFFIGYFLGTKQVGIYNAAVPIATLMLITQEIFLHLSYPIFNKEYSLGNKRNIEELSKQIYKWIFALNLPILLILLIFPDNVISILFGSEYIEGSNALRILALGIFISSACYISQRLLLMKGLSSLLFIDLLFASIVNIILNIILIPYYGITGAAMATTISWIILGFIWIYQTKKYLYFYPFRRELLKIILVTLIPLSILLAINYIFDLSNISFIFTVLLYGFIYIIILIQTECYDENDKVVFSSIKHKVYILFNKRGYI